MLKITDESYYKGDNCTEKILKNLFEDRDNYKLENEYVDINLPTMGVNYDLNKIGNIISQPLSKCNRVMSIMMTYLLRQM